MFKTYFLLGPGPDPYRYQGAEAAAQIKSLFPAVSGYVQTRALPGQASAAFSGTAELWFTEAAAAHAAMAVDFSPMLTPTSVVQSSLAGIERVVVRTPGYITADSPMKGVYPFRRKPDMPVDAFQSHWWHTHGPIAGLTEEALSYIQIHVLPECYVGEAPYYDGITEISWPDADAAGRAINSRQMTEDQANDAPNFVDLQSVALYLAEEEIVIAP